MFDRTKSDTESCRIDNLIGGVFSLDYGNSTSKAVFGCAAGRIHLMEINQK
jgi:hypothetical protein